MNSIKKDTSQETMNKLGLVNIEMIRQKIGGDIQDWQIHEIGDGNVNLIFRISGPKGQILAKQAVPYLRCVGEAWPLSMERNFFEYTALKEHSKHAGALMPEVYSFDKSTAALMMEFLEGHIILRKKMMAAVEYPLFTDHITDYMAKTLFFTSDLALSAAEKKEKMKIFCDNTDLCKITEDLIFTDPYQKAELNRWNSPWLDATVEEIQNDLELKISITEMKAKFLTSAEALVHGDLHSGSIMVTPTSTKVIDPEFAFYGPMGFDIGLLLGNFLMSYFSQAGLGETEESRLEYEDWILNQTKNIWIGFSAKFCALWDEHLSGDLLSKNLQTGPQAKKLIHEVRKNYMARLFQDSIRFAAAEMIRRILGLAHVADLDEIPDPMRRSVSEIRSLKTARELLVHHQKYNSIEQVAELAKSIRFSSRALNPSLEVGL